MLWSKAIQPWTAVRRRFHRQVEEWLSQQQARFLTCVPQNSSTKRKNYSNSRVTRGICVEVLINLQLFEEIRNFTAHRNSSSLIKNAVWRVDIEGFSPSVNLWFVAGSMWLMSRTQSHSTCWGLRQNKTNSFIPLINEQRHCDFLHVSGHCPENFTNENLVHKIVYTLLAVWQLGTSQAQ